MSAEPLSKYFTKDFLNSCVSLADEARFAWKQFSADPSREKISALLESLRFIFNGILPEFQKNPETTVLVVSSMLKKIIGDVDLFTIENINTIKQALDEKIDDVMAIDSLSMGALLEVENQYIENQQINQHIRLLVIQIECDLDKKTLRESDIQNIIEKSKRVNLKFINSMKAELKKDQDENVKVKVENKCNEIFERLQILSTQPFIHKAIDNISKNGNRLNAKAENEEDQDEKTKLLEKAELNKQLASELLEESNKFYASPEITSDKAKEFFKSFDNKIEAKEKELDIPREIWKPIVLNALIAGTGVGLLAIIGKASYGAYDYLANKNSSASFFFFAHAKSYEIAEKGRETAKTLLEEFPRNMSAACA